MSEAAKETGEASAPNVLAGRLRLSMIRLGRQLRRQDPSELTIAQLSALATVVSSGPLGVGQLAEIEGLPSPAMTRLADKLEEAGLLARHMNPADRRGVHLVPTAKGADLLDRRAQAGDAWLAERLAGLSKTDRLALERAVDVLESLATERPVKATPATPATSATPATPTTPAASVTGAHDTSEAPARPAGANRTTAVSS